MWAVPISLEGCKADERYSWEYRSIIPFIIPSGVSAVAYVAQTAPPNHKKEVLAGLGRTQGLQM